MPASWEIDSIGDAISFIYSDMEARGFSVMQVGSGAEDRGLAYTIGLTEYRDHPEILVAGYPLNEASSVLYVLATVVTSGRRIDRSYRLLYCQSETLGLLRVDHRYLDAGLMAVWNSLYGDRPLFEQRAIQVVLPDGACCYEHQTSQPLLGRLPRRRRPRRREPEEERLVVRLPA